ncbi:unnamed protein product [Chilo suppressalis]|uniref:Amino acid transporter transmembrane domain-containing protein n=1 Tax=Chilo suppressalis TaxID=168631 RepID=A0ABN8L7Y6_CHISP|nr:unnamed protein product [Chilo suppressalis]
MHQRRRIESLRSCKRAAFEAVSKIIIQPVGHAESVLDFRTARLPRFKPEGIDDFDPRDHREPKCPISNWMAYFNLIRTGFGAGMLGLPLAMSQAGIILGTFLMIIIGLLITHMHHTLLNCLNEISRQLRIPHVSYRYGFRIALLHGPAVCQFIGKRGPAIITTFMLLSQLGICTVFVAFTSDSLKDLMDWESANPALLALLVPYLLLEYFMKTLKIISYISLLGNVLNLIGLILVFYHIFKDPRKDFTTVVHNAMSLLFAFGIMLFNMSAISVVLTLDKALKNPKILTKKLGVLNIGMLVPTVVATIFSVLGYWAFGTMEENILRSLPYDDNVSIVAIGIYLLAVAFAYPIQCYPAIQIILETVKNRDMLDPPSESSLKIIETISRPCFVLLSFAVCYLAPFQAPIVAFVGHLCTTMLALVFPALMELCIRYPDDYGSYKIYLLKDLCIILGGIFTWTCGVVLSGYLIYIRVLSLSSPNATD